MADAVQKAKLKNPYRQPKPHGVVLLLAWKHCRRMRRCRYGKQHRRVRF
jgi:hypothetical protein